MKNYVLLVLFVVSSLLLFASSQCMAPPVSTEETSSRGDSNLELEESANTVIQVVSGHVEVEVAGIVEKYSFTARKSSDGSVKGKWQVRDPWAPGDNHILRGNVTCFTVCDDGKTAWIGGIIEKANLSGVGPGFEVYWTVVDNGEGASAIRDLATDLTFGVGGNYFPPGSGVAEAHCVEGSEPTNIPPLAIVRGNVDVICR